MNAIISNGSQVGSENPVVISLEQQQNETDIGYIKRLRRIGEGYSTLAEWLEKDPNSFSRMINSVSKLPVSEIEVDSEKIERQQNESAVDYVRRLRERGRQFDSANEWLEKDPVGITRMVNNILNLEDNTN